MRTSFDPALASKLIKADVTSTPSTLICICLRRLGRILIVGYAGGFPDVVRGDLEPECYEVRTLWWLQAQRTTPVGPNLTKRLGIACGFDRLVDKRGKSPVDPTLSYVLDKLS